MRGDLRRDDLYACKVHPEIRSTSIIFHQTSGVLADDVLRKAAGEYFFSEALSTCSCT